MAPRHLLASVTLLLTVSLVGCSDGSPDAEPDPTDTPTSVSPTDEETEAEKLGPVKTVRAWVKAYNHVIETGDTAPIYALSTRSCESCRDHVSPLAETHRDGGRYKNAGSEILSIKKDPDFADNLRVHTAIRNRAGTIWASESAEPVSFDAQDELLSFELRRKDGKWLVQLVYSPF